MERIVPMTGISRVRWLLISSVSDCGFIFIFLGCLRGTEGQIQDSVTRLGAGRNDVSISTSDKELDHFEASYRRANKAEGGSIVKAKSCLRKAA
jgi:hypothetical protein